MSRVVTRFDGPDVDALLRPRTYPVAERLVGEGVFEAEAGAPMREYRRTVTLDGNKAEQTVTFQLALPYFGWIFIPFFRHALRKPARDRPQWWLPPDRFDARATTVLGTLCAAAVLFGYINTLFNQTIAFAADEFHANNAAQGVAGGFVRAGGVLAFVIVALADKRGRRPVILGAGTAGCLLALTGAVAPSLPWLTGSQVLTQGCAYGLFILLPVVAVEELPAGSRAYAVGLLAMAAALGAGASVLALRLADIAVWGWRLVYVIPVFGLLLLPGIGRRLPESRRFEAPHVDAPLRGHGRRLWLLAAAGFLLNIFVAPDAQFGNRFLKHERHYTGGGIATLSIVSGTPGAIGIIVGGLLADRRGRKPVAFVALTLGTVLSVAFYFASGAPMWLWAIVSNIVTAAEIPALGVYGPELFPTSLRGTANGMTFLVALAGSVAGLLAVGGLSDQFGSIGPAMAIVGVGPVLLAFLVALAFPETARRELEDLNPEDRGVP
ncbi:MAG TPA: MFS transporter [Acidimicrobiales bacterium]|nr:MFS transporter [Acidimicrobiales bacterium]